MAKKSVKLGLRSGSAVESGDVNVTYNGVRIAGLSESTTATLETENTIVEHDIEIEYTKPESPAAGWTETVCINKNNIVTTIVPEATNQYMASLPISDLLNEVNFNDFCVVEISGDASITAQTMATDGGDGLVQISVIDYTGSIDAPFYDINIVNTPEVYQGINLFISNYSGQTPPTVNLKVSIVTKSESPT